MFKLKKNKNMAKLNRIQIGQKYKIDSYRVSQYENERIVDIVEVVESPKKFQKKVLCFSPKLQANILVFATDMKFSPTFLL